MGRNTSSGIKGISWDKQAKKWRLWVHLYKKRWYMGAYSSLEKAKELKLLAEEKGEISYDQWLDWYNTFKSTLPKPNVFEDLTGQRFGRLLALRSELTGQKTYWYCKCDCGKEIKVSKSAIKNGSQVSCGCHKRDYVTSTFSDRFGYVNGTCVTHLKTKKLRKSNMSGVKGVTFHSKNNKWMAQITFKRKHYYLGTFENIEDAAAARKEAEERLFVPFLQWYEEHKKTELK